MFRLCIKPCSLFPVFNEKCNFRMRIRLPFILHQHLCYITITRVKLTCIIKTTVLHTMNAKIRFPMAWIKPHSVTILWKATKHCYHISQHISPNARDWRLCKHRPSFLLPAFQWRRKWRTSSLWEERRKEAPGKEIVTRFELERMYRERGAYGAPVYNFGKFVNSGLGTLGSERVQLPLVFASRGKGSLKLHTHVQP